MLRKRIGERMEMILAMFVVRESWRVRRWTWYMDWVRDKALFCAV